MTYKVYSGSAGADLLDASGLAAGDAAVLRGNGGDDTLIGSSGNDRFDGGFGNDLMYGGAGDDLFFTYLSTAPFGGRDTIDGGSGHDKLVIAVNSTALNPAAAAELQRLSDYVSNGNFSTHFTSDLLRLDMTNVESVMVRLNGVLEDLGPLAPQYNATNGHYYQFVNTATVWTDAKARAESSTYMGMHGHLATVTSQNENDFVQHLANGNLVWLGGSDEGHEGRWQWASGPEAGNAVGYTNWHFGEPNNMDGHENCLVMYETGLWNDDWNNQGKRYVIEYEIA